MVLLVYLAGDHISSYSAPMIIDFEQLGGRQEEKSPTIFKYRSSHGLRPPTPV